MDSKKNQGLRFLNDLLIAFNKNDELRFKFLEQLSYLEQK
jgi:hypothetical protein